MLSYSKGEIINQNILRLMPKVFAEKHDSVMHRFLMTSESKIVGMERLAFCQNKQGYAVPVTVMVKALPNLN